MSSDRESNKSCRSGLVVVLKGESFRFFCEEAVVVNALPKRQSAVTRGKSLWCLSRSVVFTTLA